jgi:RNA polymerase sigma-70 factor, ECF subfamily
LDLMRCTESLLPSEEAVLRRADAERPHGEEPDGGEVAPGEPRQVPSFEQLYALYFGFTWRVLGHLGVPDHALDDAVQEVWITVHRRLESFEGRSALRTWLFGIAFNLVRNQRRADERRARHLAANAAPLAPAPDPEAARAGQEAWALVQRFLSTLDEQRRAIFACNLLEHLSAVETAEATGVDVATVYKRVRSLRHAFRLWLDAQHDGTGSRSK